MSRALGALVVGLLLSACTRGPVEIPAPEYGRSVCAACGSTIDDPRFAAQYALADGTVKSFDDPVCLFRALRAEPSPPVAVRFHAFGRDQWLSAGEVWLARTPKTESPRGAGWAAYPSFGEAQDAVAAAGSGEILQFDQARIRLGADG
jgi:hypothetical protein